MRREVQRGNAIRTDERQARNYVYSSLLTDVIIVLECQRCVLQSPLQRLRQMSRSLTHLHDLPGAGADGLESPEGVSEGEARLGLRPALHQLHRAGNQADLAGEVHDPVHLDKMRQII